MTSEKQGYKEPTCSLIKVAWISDIVQLVMYCLFKIRFISLCKGIDAYRLFVLYITSIDISSSRCKEMEFQCTLRRNLECCLYNIYNKWPRREIVWREWVLHQQKARTAKKSSSLNLLTDQFNGGTNLWTGCSWVLTLVGTWRGTCN